MAIILTHLVIPLVLMLVRTDMAHSSSQDQPANEAIQGAIILLMRSANIKATSYKNLY